MNFQLKILDPFQIIGFVISIGISVGLIITSQDTIASVSLGLILAILTQLFDLQMRHIASEKRILQANHLSQALYHDETLFEHIQSIVRDYNSIKDIWLEQFKLNADNAIVECRDTLHTMADQGYTYTDPYSPLPFGLTAFEQAKECIRIVVVVCANIWRDDWSEQYLQANIAAINRGVSVTRIILLTRESLAAMVDMLKDQHEIGVNVRVGLLDDAKIPDDLKEDCLIMDDRAVTRLEFDRKGNPKRGIVYIDRAVVQRKVGHFERLLQYTKQLDKALDDMN